MLIQDACAATATHRVHDAESWQCRPEAGSDAFGRAGPWIIEARSRALLLQPHRENKTQEGSGVYGERQECSLDWSPATHTPTHTQFKFVNYGRNLKDLERT